MLKLIAPIMVCATVLLTAVAGKATAGTIESLIMPGPVIEGHAEYEEECRRCHRPFSKKSQNELCLDCHEDLAHDVTNRQGFHGRAGVVEANCSTCHPDHLGRDAQVTQFSMDTFDHDMTDYPLEGGHIGVTCRSCHKVGDKFREAPGMCIDCHKDDDVHKGNLGEECADCHSVKSWRKQQDFDHDDTKFRLRGKHEDVACDSCHAAQKYEDTPMECIACHRFDDVHAGNYGSKCNDCHNDEGWEKISFDHDTTDFPLTGRHRKVKCETCHGNDVMADDLKTNCVSCHKNDDEHRGQFGSKCESCHRTSDWTKVKFDHDRETDFPLRGGHKDQLCGACHRGELELDRKGERAEVRKCIECHKTDDVHAGEEGEVCDQCHNENGWGEKVRFEHDMTRFPLIGLHAVAPCEECHLSAVYTEASTECNDCHEGDDSHERRLGPECVSCHNPNAWTLWEFDHDKQTDFRLEGSHKGIDCHACHRKPVKKSIKLSHACGNCHREDDVHDGRFSRYCDRCHNTESFDQVEMMR